MAFLALSFLFVIIVPLLSYDELKHSLIQTPCFVQLSLTANSEAIAGRLQQHRDGIHEPLCIGFVFPGEWCVTPWSLNLDKGEWCLIFVQQWRTDQRALGFLFTGLGVV